MDKRTEKKKGKIEKEVAAEGDSAVAFADSGTLEPIADLARFVYSERRSA